MYLSSKNIKTSSAHILVIGTIGNIGKSGKVAKYPVTSEISGEILGIRKIQDRGRVQIPKKAREQLKLSDGDYVWWVKSFDGKFHIVKSAVVEEGRIRST